MGPGDLSRADAAIPGRDTRGPSSTATWPSSISPGTSAGSTRPPGAHSSSSIDRIVEQVVAGLPDDAALLVTADHGMLDVPAETRLDLDGEPDLADGVRVLAGEPRARYVHAGPGAEDDVLDRWRTVLGDRAWVAGRDEAVASGIFGPVDDAHAARIGDVVALARGTWAFLTPEREPGPSRLAAYHGSLTATELAIPLLLARGSALG